MARNHLYLVRTDVAHDQHGAFVDAVRGEHLEAVAAVPGVARATCLVHESPLNPRYLLVYELADPTALQGAEWQAVIADPAWASAITPHLLNCQQALYAPAGGGADLTHSTRWIYWVMMDVEPHKETLLGEVYDAEHLPALMQVPGAVSSVRFTTRDSNHPRYLAAYEGEPGELFSSAQWNGAGEVGRWPTEVRPYTHNKRFILSERLGA